MGNALCLSYSTQDLLVEISEVEANFCQAPSPCGAGWARRQLSVIMRRRVLCKRRSEGVFRDCPSRAATQHSPTLPEFIPSNFAAYLFFVHVCIVDSARLTRCFPLAFLPLLLFSCVLLSVFFHVLTHCGSLIFACAAGGEKRSKHIFSSGHGWSEKKVRTTIPKNDEVHDLCRMTNSNLVTRVQCSRSSGRSPVKSGQLLGDIGGVAFATTTRTKDSQRKETHGKTKLFREVKKEKATQRKDLTNVCMTL